MKILVLGDVMGPSGVKAIKERLPKIINDKKVDFRFSKCVSDLTFKILY